MGEEECAVKMGRVVESNQSRTSCVATRWRKSVGQFGSESADGTLAHFNVVQPQNPNPTSELPRVVAANLGYSMVHNTSHTIVVHGDLLHIQQTLTAFCFTHLLALPSYQFRS